MPRIALLTHALIALLIFTSTAAATSSALIVGMELSYPPFEMTDARGEPSGISVEMARAIGEILGREVIIENIPFDGLIPALRTGKIHMILSSMTATQERARVVDFSEPYLSTGLCLLLNRASEVTSIDELNRPGVVIAVKRGTTGHAYASRHLSQARILVLDKEAAAVLELVQGKIDAFIYDQMSVYSHWQRNRETTRAILEPFQREYWAVGLPKGSEDLRLQINDALDRLRGEGFFERLGDKYLGEQKRAFKELGYGFYY
ncbi:extracellular solute-binding protein family 3 [Desulfurispirillum indicum S5]|uniref:Extracellular solute-binding protein family 3 n=1 Tax=Desulfurispirillum indicum (strain ATCC BAA-1389 / DSM 22839 / S5) TaxID=653733 RepID=E6W094_DESIS|nr:transporter substrate-binding domain-containing protein [Desulfurispirillum indicum]ADU65220.1 extracellular solute-binding protein family 3 [Desulfurispirillum indicum S5]